MAYVRATPERRIDVVVLRKVVLLRTLVLTLVELTNG